MTDKKSLGNERISFWDDDIEFTDGYEKQRQNAIDQVIVVNNSQKLIPNGGEQLNVQPTAATTMTEYSVREKYRSTFSTTRDPEEFDVQAEMFPFYNLTEIGRWNVFE